MMRVLMHHVQRGPATPLCRSLAIYLCGIPLYVRLVHPVPSRTKTGPLYYCTQTVCLLPVE